MWCRAGELRRLAQSSPSLTKSCRYVLKASKPCSSKLITDASHYFCSKYKYGLFLSTHRLSFPISTSQCLHHEAARVTKHPSKTRIAIHLWYASAFTTSRVSWTWPRRCFPNHLHRTTAHQNPNLWTSIALLVILLGAMLLVTKALFIARH